MSTAYIALGSNLGDRESNLLGAIRLLQENGIEIEAVSSIYETEALGFESETTFYNMVIRVITRFNAFDLLKTVKKIESDLGRIKLAPGVYESRTIDLDILFFDEEVINSDELTIPHPHIDKRRFVLVPLNELNPLLVNPLTKVAMNFYLEKCPDSSETIQIVANTEFSKKLE